MILAARCFVARLHRPKRFADTPPALAENRASSLGKELPRIGVFAFTVFVKTVSTRCVAKSLDAPEFFPSPSLARWTRITIKNLFSLLQLTRSGEVATKDF
jgi:hypothetical protein